MFTATAQHQISGTVKDGADGSPVPYATAALLRPDTSAIIGVTTGNDGKFVIQNITAGDYLLQISFIGYQRVYRQVNVPTQSDLGEIFLSESANQLNEVVITGRRALVEQRLDRIVVNVSGNIITSGINVNDLLKQMPGLIVDQNGSVRLNGRPATVYIDGRPTRLPAEQIAQMLNGMMGDVVDRVELIDNPSSRYEAGLSLAIVNIRLKRDASLGINGSAQVGAGFTDYDFASRGGLNLNYRSKKLNVFGNYGYSKTPFYQEQEQIRSYDVATPVTYDMYNLQRFEMPGHTIRAGIDGFISPKHTIGFLFTGSFSDRDGALASNSKITRTGFAEIDSSVISDTRYTNKYNSQMYNLNYRFNISEGQELTVDADYGKVYARSWQVIKSRYFDATGAEKRLPSEFQYNGPRNIDVYSLKLDYVKPFEDKSRLEAGIKTGQTVTDNEFVYENRYDGEWVNDPNQSNRFKYTEAVSAAYATYSRQFGKFSAMAGLRTEYTYMKGESPTMDTTFSRSYLDWFPSAYVQYQINEKQALNLSYSRKLNRPGYSLLNPFRTYADPFTSASGNPDLQPEYLNTIALRYNIGGYNISASYNAVNDVIEKYFEMDDTNRNINITSDNLGKRQSFTLNGFAPIPIAKWYALNINVQVGYNMIDALYDNEQVKIDYFNASASAQHSFTILPTLRANIQMMYMNPTRAGIIAELDDFWMINGQIEKTFFNRRLSLTLSCNDIFPMFYTGKINFGNVNQTFRENMHQRQTMLTARYTFGSQQIRAARNRTVGIEGEMGRAR
jgi:hypothetical protein